MSKEYAASIFDPNVWYHISEARVDNYNKTKFQSSFQVISDNGTVVVYPAVSQHWQLLPVSPSVKGRYALRNHQTGVAKQLGVCHLASEQARSKTQPCMRASDGSEEQMWDIADWGDETLRFVNVANGTDYVLDVHPGNPVFLNDDIETDEESYQPAQHWLITSVDEINDGAYSTTFTSETTEATAAVTTTDPSSSTSNPDSSSSTSTPESSSHSSLSTGAAAGIGIGVGLGVILLALLGFFLWRRRNNAKKRAALNPEAAPAIDEKQPPTYTGQYYPQNNQGYSQQPQEYSQPQELPTHSNVAEVPGVYHSELDSTPVSSTVASSPDWKKQPSPQAYQL